MHRCPLPVKLVALEELELDLRNYRLPIRVTDERQAVLYMLENEKILELAEEIVKYGYLDNEFPLVVADGSRFKVVEGNRRVTALKLLNDPTLIEKYGPDKSHRYKRLKNKYQDRYASIPSQIRVMVADSEEELQPHIARLHTKTSKKQWSTEQQAQFYYAQIEAGTTIAQLKERYNIGSRLKRLLQTASFSHLVEELARRLDEESVKRLKTIKPSPLEYALKVDEIRAKVGIEFAPSGLLSPEGTTAEIANTLTDNNLKALLRLATLMTDADPKLNTRHPALNGDRNALEDVLQYLECDEKPIGTGKAHTGESSAVINEPAPHHPAPVSSSNVSSLTEVPQPQTRVQQSDDHNSDIADHKELHNVTPEDADADLQQQLKQSLKGAKRDDTNHVGNKFAHLELRIDDSNNFMDANALVLGILKHGDLPQRGSCSRQTKLYVLAPALRPIFELTMAGLRASNIEGLQLEQQGRSRLKEDVQQVTDRLCDSEFIRYLSEQFPKLGGFHSAKSTITNCNFVRSATIVGNTASHGSYRNLSEDTLKSAFNDAVLFALLCQQYAVYKRGGSW